MTRLLLVVSLVTMAGCAGGDDPDCTTNAECEGGMVCERGNCVHVCNRDAECSEENFICVNGICTESTAGSCGDNSGCSDSNPCTDDICASGGTCVFPNNTAACDDNDPCTTNDTCADGVCAGDPGACVEVCNGEDDDGDGVADDGLVCLSSAVRVTDAVTDNLHATVYNNAGVRAAFNATDDEFAIVWSDYRDYETLGEVTYFTRIDLDGEEIGPHDYVDGVVGSFWSPQIAYHTASNSYGVAVDADDTGEFRPTFQLLNRFGTRQLSLPLTVDTGHFSFNPVSLSAYDGGYAIVTTGRTVRTDPDEDLFNVYLSLLDTAGAITETALQITNIDNPQGGSPWTGAWDPVVASDGTQFAILYKDGPDQGCGTPYQDFYGELVVKLVDTDGADVTSATLLSTNACYATVIWTGTEYAAVWYWMDTSAVNQLRFQRIDSTGAPVGSSLQLTDGNAPSISPTVVWTGDQFLVSYRTDANDSPDENDLQLHMVAVAGDGSAASNPVVLSGDAHMLGNGSIAGTNDTFLAAFNAVEDTGCTDPCKRDIFTRAFSYVPEESP